MYTDYSLPRKLIYDLEDNPCLRPDAGSDAAANCMANLHDSRDDRGDGTPCACAHMRAAAAEAATNGLLAAIKWRLEYVAACCRGRDGHDDMIRLCMESLKRHQ